MSDEVKEHKVKKGRPARQLSITDVCWLVRYYMELSYKSDRTEHYLEDKLFNYIKENNYCSSLSKSPEEAEADLKFYEDNPRIYSHYNTSEAKERAAKNILTDEKTIASIREMVLELDDKVWTRILTRKRQAEHRSKKPKKKISVNGETFYNIKRVKQTKFNNASWDEVLTKFVKAIETIDNLNEGFIDDINSNEDALKLLNSLFD